MRGKDEFIHHALPPPGLTPAYAGKSPCVTLRTLGTGAHPRVCGEKPVARVTASTIMGSPPRMRGKVCLGLPNTDYPGLTPAYAGKRYSFYHDAGPIWAHPRVCGEKRCRAAPLPRVTGSPPRMRGKDFEGIEI